MALTVYCTVEHVRFVWSNHGVSARADDRDGHNSTDTIDDAISKATTDVNQYLFQRYTPAVIAGCTWVKWATAFIAAQALAIRRGNSVPQGIQDQVDRYLEDLKAIAAGQIMLTTDTGLASPEHDNLPGVSNLRVDSRFRAPIRRVPQTSTKTPQSPNRNGFDLQGYPYPYPYSL